MAFERLLVVALICLIVWLVIKHILIPFTKFVLTPLFEIIEAKQKRIAANARLQVAKEEANKIRVEMQIDKLSEELVDELTQPSEAAEKKESK
jgi:hypothetical protein